MFRLSEVQCGMPSYDIMAHPRELVAMKPRCMSFKWVIAAAAVVTIIYLICMLLGFPSRSILALYGLSVFAYVWMVIRILKDPFSTDKTFDELFYQDRDDLRRSGKD
jgi:hypothetical protein